MRLFPVILALFLARGPLAAAVSGVDYDYKDGKTKLKGYLAYDDSRQGGPGVLVVPQWMGLTDYERGRARQLAELGYVALVADVYGMGLTAKDGKEAGALAGQYKGDRALFRSRLKAALSELRKQSMVDSTRLAAIGYCFGGTGVLELARSGAKLNGVVSFHGGLDSPDPDAGRNIKAKVLVLHGADDPYVAKKDMEAFEQELKAAKADYQIVLYSGAVHAFTQPMAGDDPSKGAAYNERADKRSWTAMRTFFDELFAKP